MLSTSAAKKHLHRSWPKKNNCVKPWLHVVPFGANSAAFVSSSLATAPVLALLRKKSRSGVYFPKIFSSLIWLTG